jgi:hypothetical protein
MEPVGVVPALDVVEDGSVQPGPAVLPPSRASLARSSLLSPGRWPASVSAWFTHARTARTRSSNPSPPTAGESVPQALERYQVE